MSEFLPLVLAAWVERLLLEGPWRLLTFLSLALVAYTARAVGVGPRARAGLVAALAIGAVVAAASRASVVDDAFIALRYAQNLLDGHGLVFNLGERVEGYTDLLWVLLVALGSAVSGAELPLVALVLDLVVVAANVVLAAATARRLAGGGFPLAAALLAGHAVFLSHGTTGLETGLVALLVQLALFQLLGPDTARAALGAGVSLTLAVLTRPDAALFLPMAAVAVATRGWRHLRWLALPCLLLVAVQAWRLGYYGDWLPNTAYAKAAGRAYWSQGFVYLAEFWLGSATLPWAVVAGLWVFRGAAPIGARLFVGLGVAVQTLYVARVGGDFMSGRFFVVILPLLAIAAEAMWRDLGARRPGAAALVAALLLAGLGSGSLVRAGSIRWYIADEGALYPVERWFPVTIDHPSWRIGTTVGRSLRDRGLTPTIAAGTIGMIGYYGQLELIDLHGLTDRTVAREPRTSRGHVGHERRASDDYLRSRGVSLVQSRKTCGELLELREVVPPTGRNPKKPWCLLRWDADLAARMRAEAPEWRLPDPWRWIDGYVLTLPDRTPEDAAATLRFLDTWIFDRYPDAARRDPIAARAATAVVAAVEPTRGEDTSGGEDDR